MTVLPLPGWVPGRQSGGVNTLLNLLGVTVLAALVLLPTLYGFARERRISRELRQAERVRRADPPDPAAARPEGAVRRPYLRAWARI